MILNLFQPIFNLMGMGDFLLTPTELITSFQGLTNWFDILSPQIIISWLIYFIFAYGIIFVLCIMPFRFFKKLLHVPKRKG